MHQEDLIHTMHVDTRTTNVMAPTTTAPVMGTDDELSLTRTRDFLVWSLSCGSRRRGEEDETEASREAKSKARERKGDKRTARVIP